MEPVANKALQKLSERAKELECIYKTEEILGSAARHESSVFESLLQIISRGMQFSSVCEVKIVYEDKVYETDDFHESDWLIQADIIVDNNISGEILVVYTQFIRTVGENQFLPEEQRLLITIANRLSGWLFMRKVKASIDLLSESSNSPGVADEVLSENADEYWKWRIKMAELLASRTNPERFGIEKMLIFGSVIEKNAKPDSKIDLVAVFNRENCKIENFVSWIDGWSYCLAEVNFNKTGYKVSDGLINLYIHSDNEIAEDITGYSRIAVDRLNKTQHLKMNVNSK